VRFGWIAPEGADHVPHSRGNCDFAHLAHAVARKGSDDMLQQKGEVI
jgi:hypothetical protein